MSLNSRQSKANALLNTTNSTRAIVVSSSKRNPYKNGSSAIISSRSSTAAAAKAPKSTATTSSAKPSSAMKPAGAFAKRNVSDTGKEYTPQTQTDKLLVSLLDDKPKKKKLPSKPKLSGLQHGVNHAGSQRENNKKVGQKRQLGHVNASDKRIKVDVVVGMPPPTRRYPSDKSIKLKSANGMSNEGDSLLMPPPPTTRSYPTEKSEKHRDGQSTSKSCGQTAKEPFKCTVKKDSMKKIPLQSKPKSCGEVTKHSFECTVKKDILEDSGGVDHGRKTTTIQAKPALNFGADGESTHKSEHRSTELSCNSTAQKKRQIDLVETMDLVPDLSTKPISLGIGKKNRVKSSRASQSTTIKRAVQEETNTLAVVGTISYTGSNSTKQNCCTSETAETAEYTADNSKDDHAWALVAVKTSFTEPIKPKHAEWYNPEEHAAMKAEASDKLRIEKEIKETTSKSRNSTSGSGINDNFVRLDLKNASGSCRGARNLKKVNKQKAWRAKYRFGKSDGPEEGIGGDDGKYGVANNRSDNKSQNENETKCFASAKNGGVDPLDDFIDGVFSDVKSTKEKGVMCARHSRPCKLMTVKRNNKGNKGRKFYVCSMPVGERCDFFKWEEDTMEATQRALLQSSSNSGFIARQVAASKARFRELTVPELRNETKKRGLNATGKKDQLVTRLVIWARDEIAESIEPDRNDKSDDTINNNSDGRPDGVGESSEEESDDESDCLDIVDAQNPNIQAAGQDKSKMIELSDDDSDSSCDDSEENPSFYDELDTPYNAQLHHTKIATTKETKESTLHESLEQYFGHAEFREGQEWAIRRCLSGERTLFVAPTGQGKSLCYALPAALIDGICLVVSPLVSLMQDQLRQLPPKIPAATLSGSMTAAQMALIIDDVMRGRYKVLFVSPERLASASFRRLIRPKFNVQSRQYERQFPSVSLLCVDEAHCLSQWGHNFRPSYLRVKSLLPLINPKSVMALTATAGPMVVRDICNTLCIPLDESSGACGLNAGGVKVLNCNRDNIDVFTMILQSNDERQYLLHKILKARKDENDDRNTKSLPIEEGCLSKGSVIIYVWRQKDTEIVAEQLVGAGISGGVVCYHGGMESDDRARAQSKFLRGKARICVATVAFGLGINKPDIEGVIHLCLPPSPEHYLQEIGRAGRDGRNAKAIALPLADEMVSRHSLAHSDRLARSQLSAIFSRLEQLVNDALGDIPEEAGVNLDADEIFVDGMHVALPVFQTVNASDCKEESIETILSLLEEESAINSSLLSVEGYLPDVATITLKKRSLEKLKNFEQIARCIEQCGAKIDEAGGHTEHGGTAVDSGFYAYSFGTYQFSVVQCARVMGPESEPRHVFAALRRLQGNGELELNLASSGRAMHLRMKQRGINLFRRKQPSDLNDGITSIIDKFSEQFASKERVSVGKVESMYKIMYKVSCCGETIEEDDDGIEDEFGRVTKSRRLVKFQELCQSYFSSAKSETAAPIQTDVIKDFPTDKALLACLSRDVSSLLQLLSSDNQRLGAGVNVSDTSCNDYRDTCVAKILHAIDAPRAPILTWYSHPLWGKYRSYSFTSVVEAVKSVCSEF